MGEIIEGEVSSLGTVIGSCIKGKKYLDNVPTDLKLAADRTHIDEVMANTNYLHGDGLFPVKNNDAILIDLNGKVTATGTTMTVIVSDYLALIDGYTLGDKNLDASKTEEVIIEPADLTNPRIDLICLKPILGESGNRQHAHGDLYAITGTPAVEPVTPDVPSGSILLAKVNVGVGVTVITNDDLTDARDYLIDIDDLDKNLRARIEEAVNQAKRELIALIIRAIEALKDEIAAGDEAVKTELQEKIDLVKADLADVTVTIAQIRTHLRALRTYVAEKVALLETKTEDLETAVQDLKDADEETEVFKQRIISKITEIQGEILSNEVAIRDNLERIEALELGGAITAGLNNLNAMVNIAKTNFKIDTYHVGAANNMYKGWVDAFASPSDIDEALSSDWVHDSIAQKIYPHVTTDPYLKALYHFNEGEGNIAIDSSENENNGLISAGATWADGKFGKALDFGGVSAVFIPDSDDWDFGTGDFTIEFQVRFNSFGDYGLISTCGRRADTEGFLIQLYSSSLRFVAGSGIGSWDRAKMWRDWSPSINTWYHVVVVRTSGVIKMFVNGIQLGNDYVCSNVINSTGTLNIGSLTADRRRFLNGKMDEVRISKGIARWTENFDVPTEEHPAGGEEVEEAIVVTKAHIADSAPDSVLLVAEGDAEVTYEVSRDNGTTFTAVVSNEVTDISGQPAGTSMRVKTVIPKTKTLDNISLWWQ